MLDVCQQVAAIPMKRVAPPETHFLERDEVQALLRHLPSDGRLALRDRGLLLFLYNTGARAQEAADLRVEHLRSRRAPDRAPPRQRRQVEDLPALAADSADPGRADRVARSASDTAVGRVHRASGGRSRDPASTRSCADTHRRSMTRGPIAGSPRTPSGTRPPCTCWRPASRSTSSASGSGTST